MADAIDEVSVQDLAEGIDAFFLLICTLLVLMMQAGFALYEVGTIARTPDYNILIKNIMDASIAYVMWLAFGSMFAGAGNRFIGWADAGPFLTGDEFAGDDNALAYLRFLFYASFAGTAVTVMSGAVADRVPYLLYGIYAVVTCGFTYPVVVHWVWSQDGWLSPVVGAFGNCGVLDFAGSGVVHALAGMTTFVWAIKLKSRDGRFVIVDGVVKNVNFGTFADHDRTKQALGTFLLWLGWYGFNCGSALSVTSTYSRRIVGVVAVNTTISPVVCCLTSIAIEWAYFENQYIRKRFEALWDQHGHQNADREQKDLHSAAINGILSGLVAITAGCATTDPLVTIPIAFGAAIIFHFAYRVQLCYGVDDAVSAVPIHLWSGIWGLLSAGWMFSRERHGILMRAYGVDETRETCQRGDQFGVNLMFALIVMAWSAATSTILYHALKKVYQCVSDEPDENFGGRPDPEDIVRPALGHAAVGAVAHMRPGPDDVDPGGNDQRSPSSTTSSDGTQYDPGQRNDGTAPAADYPPSPNPDHSDPAQLAQVHIQVR